MKNKIFVCLIALFGTITMKSQRVSDYNLLLIDGVGGIEIANAKATLENLGHTVTLKSSSSLISGYDYSSYDVIIFGRDSPPPPFMSEILNLNINNQLGIVLLWGGRVSSSTDIGTGITYSSTDFTINDNSHYITQSFSTGVLDVGFDYKSNLTSISSNCTILGSVSSGNGSLVVHNNYRRVLSPYYGHHSGSAQTADALLLLDRIIAYAAHNTTLNTNELPSFTNIKIFPNPTKDYIQISNLKEEESYKIYNTIGSEVLSGKVLNNTQIDLKDLSNGVYFLKFDNVNTIKFIKE